MDVHMKNKAILKATVLLLITTSIISSNVVATNTQFFQKVVSDVSLGVN